MCLDLHGEFGRRICAGLGGGGFDVVIVGLDANGMMGRKMA